MNTKHPGYFVDTASVSPSRNLRKNAKILGAKQQKQHQQQQRKQVRRRLHTTRPYQERLLNMAEARREIVTALKFHRAAMKQASEEKQQQQKHHQLIIPNLPSQPSDFSSSFEQDSRFKSRRNPRIYPSCTTPNNFNNFSNHMEDYFPPIIQNPNSCPVSSQFSPPLVDENPNFSLPNQTLGLNLNLHHFNNLDSTLNNNNNINNSLVYFHASPTPSSPPPPPPISDQGFPSIGNSHSQGEGVSSMVDTIESSSTATTHVNGGLHRAMDDEGMEEIRSLGELYQMELNDTMSLITSSWWFNFLNSIENDDDDSYHVLDEHIEIPTCMNANDQSCLELCTEDYFQYPTLP